MNNEPIETTIVTPEPSRAIIVRQNSEIGILRPAGSLDAIADAFKEYQAVCERILTKDDYQLYEKKPRKKKSAWRKLATAFNVSTEKVSEDIQRQDGHVVSARYTIRAFTPSRRMEAEGFCEVHEKCCASARGDKCHKSAWKGHYCCQKDCDGRKHWSHPEHDIIATAQTRATNRAIADLIGCGEVSAEELVDDEPKVTAEPAKPEPPTKPAAPKFATEKTREWFIKELGDARDHANGFLIDLGWIMPNESVCDMPLRWVPISKTQIQNFKQRMGEWIQEGRAEKPYDANPEAPLTDEPKPGPKPKAAASSDESWRNVIISLPRKGMKRDEYLANPDTIGSLFDLRHGNDEEAQAARQRLFGLLKWEPKPREFKGKVYQPSDSDWATHKGLQQFSAWFAQNHPGEEI